MNLITADDPNDCRLQVTQEEQDALVGAVHEPEHQKLLGGKVLQHLKSHHNYGSRDPEKPPINLQHQIIEG